MKYRIVPFAVISIGFLATLFSLRGPWYLSSFEYSLLGIQTNLHQELYLHSILNKGTIAGYDATQTITIQELTEIGIAPHFTTLIQQLTITTVLSCLFCAIALGGIIVLLVFKRHHKGVRSISILFGVLTFLLTISSVLFFMMGWETIVEGGINQFFNQMNIQSPIDDSFGFWYHKVQNGNTFSIGPGSAWYMMIIAGICGLASALLITRQHHSS